MNVFAILVETSPSMTSSRIFGEFPNPKFNLFLFAMLLSCFFLYFEAEMNIFVTAVVMSLLS